MAPRTLPTPKREMKGRKYELKCQQIRLSPTKPEVTAHDFNANPPNSWHMISFSKFMDWDFCAISRKRITTNGLEFTRPNSKGDRQWHCHIMLLVKEGNGLVVNLMDCHEFALPVCIFFGLRITFTKVSGTESTPIQ